MGRNSGKRRGQERAAPSSKTPGRGKNLGQHKDRRRQQRAEDRKLSRLERKAKSSVLKQEAQKVEQARAKVREQDAEQWPQFDRENGALIAAPCAKIEARSMALSEDEVQAKAAKLAEKKKRQRDRKEERAHADNEEKKVRSRRKLLREQLKSAIEKNEERLKCWYPGKEEHLRRREAQKNRYDPNRLRGAAKPAEEAYPWLYPEYHEAKAKKELEEEERERKKGENYFEVYDKHWGKNGEMRKVLKDHVQLGEQIVTWMEGKAIKKAAKLLEKAAEMDGDGFLGYLLPCVRCAAAIEAAELGEARKIAEDALKSAEENHFDLRRDAFLTMLAWDLVLIEYIGCRVLKEEGATEDDLSKALKRAVDANQFIPYILRFHFLGDMRVDIDHCKTQFSDEVDSLLEKFVHKSPPKRIIPREIWCPESVAVVYYSRSVDWWRDTDENMEEFFELSCADELENCRRAFANRGATKEMDQMTKMFWDIWNKEIRVVEEESDDDEENLDLYAKMDEEEDEEVQDDGSDSNDENEDDDDDEEEEDGEE